MTSESRGALFVEVWPLQPTSGLRLYHVISDRRDSSSRHISYLAEWDKYPAKRSINRIHRITIQTKSRHYEDVRRKYLWIEMARFYSEFFKKREKTNVPGTGLNPPFEKVNK